MSWRATREETSSLPGGGSRIGPHEDLQVGKKKKKGDKVYEPSSKARRPTAGEGKRKALSYILAEGRGTKRVKYRKKRKKSKRLVYDG